MWYYFYLLHSVMFIHQNTPHRYGVSKEEYNMNIIHCEEGFEKVWTDRDLNA